LEENEMKRKRKILILFALLFVSSTLCAGAVPLNGTWYTGSNNGTPSLSNPSSNSFVWGTDGTSATASKGALWSYFSDQALANDGEVLTASFTVTPLDATATAQSFRFGLYNDGGTQVLNNLSGTNSDSGFLSTLGYFAKWNTAGTGDLLARTAGKTNPCSDSSDVDNLGSITGVPVLTQNVAYDMTFSVTRNNATEYQIAATMDDGTTLSTMSFPTTNINATTFNTFFMLHPPTGIDSFEFANLQVELIPEPATMALLALGSLGLIRRRRK
jgi:hypothetical protein